MLSSYVYSLSMITILVLIRPEIYSNFSKDHEVRVAETDKLKKSFIKYSILMNISAIEKSRKMVKL